MSERVRELLAEVEQIRSEVAEAFRRGYRAAAGGAYYCSRCGDPVPVPDIQVETQDEEAER